PAAPLSLHDALPISGAGPAGEGDPEAGPGRDVHPAVPDRQPFLEKRIEPVEMLDPRLAGISGGQMQVYLHREMRGESQMAVVGEDRKSTRLNSSHVK